MPADIVAEVDRIAVISYVNVGATHAWNAQRREGELRLLTGWAWVTRRGGVSRQGFKTRTVAYRDAYYALVRDQDAPHILRNRRKVA